MPCPCISKTPTSLVAPKSVFHAAQQSKLLKRISFKIEHRINDMLEDTWTGNAAVLGYMTDHQNADTGGFGQRLQTYSAFPYLGNQPRRRIELVCIDCLYRINDYKSGIQPADLVQDIIQIGFRQQVKIGGDQCQPIGAHLDLARAFLATDVHNRAGKLRQFCREIRSPVLTFRCPVLRRAISNCLGPSRRPRPRLNSPIGTARRSSSDRPISRSNTPARPGPNPGADVAVSPEISILRHVQPWCRTHHIAGNVPK